MTATGPAKRRKEKKKKTHPDVQLGWSVLLEGGGGGGGHLAGVFERLGAVPEEDGARREVDEHQRAAAAEGLHAATHLQQVGLLLLLAADNVQPPSLRLVRLAALATLNRHPSWESFKRGEKKKKKNKEKAQQKKIPPGPGRGGTGKRRGDGKKKKKKKERKWAKIGYGYHRSY